jgi:hypothetical protein
VLLLLPLPLLLLSLLPPLLPPLLQLLLVVEDCSDPFSAVGLS